MQENKTKLPGVFERLFRNSTKLLFTILFLFSIAKQTNAASGITYTGRILKGDSPVESGTVVFDIWIKTIADCPLYYEQRSVSMVDSAGTYSFDIGDGTANNPTYYFSGSNTVADLFDNTKTFNFTSGCGTATYQPASLTEGRRLLVNFTPPGDVVQSLPELVINPVPSSYQAYNANKIDGYGTGELLKIQTGVTQNGNLTQIQYDEFWSLINGGALTTNSDFSGDVTGKYNSISVNKIKGKDIDATGIAINKILKYDGTKWVMGDDLTGGAAIQSLGGLSGSTQTLSIGTSGDSPSWSSVTSDHKLNIPMASAGVSVTAGLISNTDYTKIGTVANIVSLPDGNIWIGDAGGKAQSKVLGGDASLIADGTFTIGTGKVDSNKILDASIVGADLNFTGLNSATSNLVIQDATGKFYNFGCVTAGHVATWTVAGWACQAVGGDHLGNHKATENIWLNGHWLSGDGDSQGIYVTSSGNVGINTSSPNALLELSPSASLNPKVRINNSSGNTQVAEIEAGNFGPGGGTIKMTASGGTAAFQLQPGDSDGSSVTYSAVGLVMNSIGQIGIGTASPLSPLHVSATNTATSGSNAAFQVTPTYNQVASTASNTDLLINRTPISVGSGLQNLIDARVSGTSKFKVDVNGYITATGINIGSYSTEKTFYINFPAVADQKVDLSLGDQFWGELEVSVTSTYQGSNATGRVTKVFAFGANSGGGGNIYLNKSNYSQVLGMAGSGFAISDITWDAALSTYKIQIVNRTANDNYVMVKLRGSSSESPSMTNLRNATIGSIYTTDNTVFSAPQVTIYGGGTSGADLSLESTSHATKGDIVIAAAGGNVGIGTDSPSQKLHVVGNLRVQGSTDCTLGDGAGATNCTSDQRLKDNVTPIPGALEKINQIRGVAFEWNHLALVPGKHAIGVIAQEVQKVFPTAVVENSSGYLAVDYAVLVSPLIEAAKELKVRNETSEAQIKALYGVIENVKKENREIKAWVCAKDPQAPFCGKN